MRAADFLGGAAAAAAVARAPGRVNLLGEHTDYNDGFMLPLATPQGTTVALAHSSDGRFHLHSATLGQTVSFAPGEAAPAGFARYVAGCIDLLRLRGAAIGPLRIHVSSDLPVGAGLSSSAALEVATLRALRTMFSVPLDDVDIAAIAQRAEIDYAGVNCGIMDQMASSLASEGRMLFVDARTLAHRLQPLPDGSEIIVIDSGVPRTLAASAYNERRAECEAAARALGVTALRDVADVAQLDGLPELLARRARHVVTENARVLEAAAGVDASRFGQLMRQSHASLRDDYGVSIAPLDRLCGLLDEHQQVFGARLTGAGFGGACVALCAAGAGAHIGRQVVARFNGTGGQASLLIPAQDR